MRPLLTTTLTLALALTTTLALAETPGPVCRNECGPRIQDQCGALAGRELRRCRRSLVRACKASSPEVACQTTDELTRNLNDRFLDPSADESLRLCEDGTFRSAVTTATPEAVTRGDWRVELVDGALVVTLAAEDGTSRQLKVEPQGGDDFLVDGAPNVSSDATEACAPPVGERAPDPVLDLRDPERVLAVTRAITDRQLRVTSSDANGQPVVQLPTFCSSGTLSAVIIPVTLIAESAEGTWSIDETGKTITMSDQDLLPASYDVEVLPDGRVLIDGQPTSVSDDRARCADIDLEARFTALLTRSAYTFEVSGGNIVSQFDATVAFCSEDRFVRKVGFNIPSRGSWRVEATDGNAELFLRDGLGLTSRHTLSQDDDGRVLIDGVAPIADPAVALRANC
jgi:hypothetical protein